ncbi:MAG: hypothetical protein CFE23_02485 [Flavobacterium sp. BFFFF1]|uniref:PAS domain S-box protein n=1 Tax=Flavobacterium sp. BFFFF1 TaxID=2015557 RepID=UPI000BCD10DE|nr:PAS domain S-box protein [Flavobacterium sp. BFFFF1]OYU81771.1 MAG: hypothetical protein CFE23_02485 [Flavobacterium sp. BFFFF1]
MGYTNADHYFLNGGGQMGELIRAKDWSRTALGDPAHWPQSLQTTVAVMLENPFGMSVIWGTEYTQLYNDGYRPILGATKHPKALGNSVRNTFPEIWDTIGPMFDAVMHGESIRHTDFLLLLNRNGYEEECYFDFSYSPIRTETGAIGGVLITVVETTEKIRVQAELIESTKELKFAMDAAELGTWDYDPFTNKFSANDRLKDWFGLCADEKIALHHATDAIADKDRERIIMAIYKALDYSSGGIFDEEYTIINPLTQREIVVEGKGRAWFNEEKIAYRFNGVLQEVTEKVCSRKTLEESEAQLRIAIEGGEFGTFDFFPNTKQLIWSDKTRELFGLPKDAPVNYETYLSAIHPDDRGRSMSIAQQQEQLKRGGLYELEYRVIGISNGQLRWLRSKGKATYNQNGEAIRYTGVVQDITKQKESAEIIRESNERFRNMVEQAPVAMSVLRGPQFVVEVANEKQLQLWGRTYGQVMNKPIFEAIPESTGQDFEQRIAHVFETGKPFVADEFPITLIRNGREETIYANFVYEPLFDSHHNVNGVLSVAIDITEQLLARRKIEEREAQFSALSDNISQFAWMADDKGSIYWYNKRWFDYTGTTLEEMEGWGWTKVHHPDHLERVVAKIQHSWDTGEVWEDTFPIRSKDGEYRWFLSRALPIRDAAGQIIRWFGTNTDINEQKQAEEQFKVLADQAPMWVWLTDKEVNVLYANPELLHFIGIEDYTAFTGRTWEEKVHSEDIAVVLQSFAQAVSEQQTFTCEFRVLNAATQQYQWFYIKAVPQVESGEFSGFIGTGININEQKIILSQLEYRKALLEAHNESSLDGILLVDTKGNMLSYNHRFIEIWNMPQTIVDAKDDHAALEFALTQLVHPETFMVRVNWMYENRDAVSVDELELKNGKVIERYGYHVAGADGNYYGCSWIFRDVTEQKQFQKIIKESEEKFRLLADSMPQHIWTSDPEGNLNYYNRSVFDYSGLTWDEIHEKGWMDIVHPDDREANIKQWLHAISTGTDFLFEHRFRKHDGTYRWQLSRAIPQRDQDGKIQMWVGTSTDIEEQKTFTRKLELEVKERTKQLELNNVQLQKMNKELQSFAYISSHDLQEPLRKIQTFASRISEKEQDNLSTDGKDMFLRMQNAANRMQTLIQDLLAYSRINPAEYEFETTDLNKIVDEIREDFHEELNEKRATISTNHLCVTDIIPFQFRQLLVNLISNALKFASPQRLPHIEIKCEVVDGRELKTLNLLKKNYCHISVSDNGIGFEQEYSEKIFEVFQRLHARNEYEGTGIGLAIVKKIVDNHHGVITANGTINKGATFDIYIPCRDHVKAIPDAKMQTTS